MANARQQSAKSTGIELQLDRCPHGVECITLRSGPIGTKLTGVKCCGRREEIRRWPMTRDDLRAAAALFEQFAEDDDDDA